MNAFLPSVNALRRIGTAVVAVASIAVGFALDARAQDPHFSQFYAAPLRNNPAATGVFNGSMRAEVNYRDQWSSVIGDNGQYRTTSAGFDANIFAFRNDFVGVGAYILNDQAGAARYNHLNAMFSGAYVKQLGGGGRGWHSLNHYLSVGGQVGIGQNSLNWNDLRFSTQFDGDGYNSSRPTQENLGVDSRTYVDFNAGLMWYGIFDDHLSLYVGGAASHLNKPNISLGNSNEPLYMKYTFNVGGEIPISKQVSLLPALQAAAQGPSLQMVLGTNFRYTNRDWQDIALKAGGWMRLVNGYQKAIATDAAIAYAGVEVGPVQIGLNYDINISTLQRVSNLRGAFEASVMYILPQNRRGGVICPRFN